MDNIKEIVKSVIGKISEKQPDTHQQILDVWNNFIDEKNREKTHFLGIKNNKVYIIVDSPIRLHNLKSKKSKLLMEVKKISNNITDIVYRVGQV